MRRVRWLWHRMASAMRLLFPLLVAALACAPSPAKAAVPSQGRRLTIVAINDTHGALLEVAAPKWIASSTESEIGGADWFGGYLEAIRADAKERGGAVIVLDAGDAFQGTPISNHFQGRSVTEGYDALGLTAAALGNHEIDVGIGVVKERIAQARPPIRAATLF